jgi:methylated-DNA-[protein]-cysteine S-methyltransferase
MPDGLHIFDTAIGPCGLRWGERGVTGAALPEATTEATLQRLKRRSPDAALREPPPEIARAAEAILALTQGENVDLGFVALDFGEAGELERGVWEITRAIPVGETLTYGEIARRLGEIGLSRAVGKALGANPIPIIVPCHRVLAADGRSGGFSAPGGVSTKLRLLNIERAHATGSSLLFDDLPLEVRRG